MRKGRSSRRSRVSRPSLGPTSAPSVEAVAAQPSTPKVVIGVSLPPAAPSEPPRADADAGTNVATIGGLASEQRLKVEAAETAEKAIEQLDSEPPPAVEAKTEEPRAEANVEETLEAKVEETTAAEPEAQVEAKADEAKSDEAAVAREELTPPAPATSDIDEESIPPVGDLAVHEKFFSQGDLGEVAADDDDELDLSRGDKAARKSAPDVVQRRARFVRYVTWAVGVSAVVCLAAVVRTAMAPSSKTLAAPAQAAMVAEPPSVKAAPPQEVAQPVATTEAPAPVATTEAPKPAAEPEAAKPAPAGDAKEEKAACKKALERGKIGDAIEAGERAVALDETDAEAWLLLGAAYQEKGKLADARRAYTSCVKLGGKGKHASECAQMLR